MALRAPLRRLYTCMITGDSEETALLRSVERAVDAGVDFVQIRRKTATARELELLVKRMAAFSRGTETRLLVNDRLDLGLEFGGVHLPESGLPAEAVRRRAPHDFLVACSTHDRQGAERAASQGADFIVFGPIFPTPSKPGHPGLGLQALQEVAAAVPVPVLALGGITPERVFQVAASGAAGIAGISVFEREESLRSLLARLDRDRW